MKGDLIDGPLPYETGKKDTVVALPGQVTKIQLTFDIAGYYVWHCHILSHEDNDMMLPFCVGRKDKDCPASLF
jgi:FtsP/CotA-like multicopper oxidase with cupredoxin domain